MTAPSGKQEGTAFDTKLVNGAVRIKIALDRSAKRSHKLLADLNRLTTSMTREEYLDYLKRIR